MTIKKEKSFDLCDYNSLFWFRYMFGPCVGLLISLPLTSLILIFLDTRQETSPLFSFPLKPSPLMYLSITTSYMQAFSIIFAFTHTLVHFLSTFLCMSFFTYKICTCVPTYTHSLFFVLLYISLNRYSLLISTSTIDLRVYDQVQLDSLYLSIFLIFF